jgi:hypothetical protein
LSDGVQFTKNDSVNANDKVIIPYGTDLTNLESRLTILENKSGSNNLITFCQSIIDHTLINSPFNSLKETIINNQKYPTTMKTLVSEDVFPKTTHTFLTVYYTSYINTNLPEVKNTEDKLLLQYYCTNETYPAIEISVINSTVVTPQFYIIIRISSNIIIKTYTINQSKGKVVIDLTADLAIVRPNEKIISAQFTPTDFGGSTDDFYRHCVNILSNIFISYTYDK